jgi:hypothetical protein
MRFALIELKICICNLIQNFEIKPNRNTPEKLELIENFLRLPKNGVNVTLERRKNKTLVAQN